MAYDILFTDLDDTLLNNQGKVSEGNRRAITAATQAGKRVVLCSGRSWRSLAFLEKELGLDAPGCYGVAFNGGVVYACDTHRFIHERSMDNTLGQSITQALKELDTDITLYAGTEMLVERETPDLHYYTDRSRVKATVIRDFSEVKEDIIKILISGPHEKLVSVAELLTPVFTGRCNIFFSSATLLEFTHPETHKGAGVRVLADYLGIPLSAVIAAGDEANDISMLQTAGLGIAVANATPEVKAAADIILHESCNEDAISRVIQDYLLACC